MENDSPAEAVLNCRQGPEYHWHAEWIAVHVLGFFVPLLLATHLFGDDSGGLFVLVMIIMFAWLIVSYRLAARHADPNSIWIQKNVDWTKD